MTRLPRVTWIPLIVASICASLALVRFLVGMSEKVRQAQTLSNLKQIGLHCMIYAQNHEERLPSLKNLSELRPELRGLSSDTPWKSPGWNLDYVTNPALSQQKLTEVGEPSQVAIVYEPVALWSRGNTRLRGVVFADGHAKLVSPQEWERVRGLSQITEGPTPNIAPWWQLGTSGPRQPISDSMAARLWACGYVFFVLLAAVLRRKDYFTGAIFYLVLGGLFAILGFTALTSLGRIGFLR